ncbi:MAG: hypothetical protein D6731_16805 [Planctomycetota bacterium]|nr:MAG: hypothetical protein D6731_16805 [Planctomycetota bacterium]
MNDAAVPAAKGETAPPRHPVCRLSLAFASAGLAFCVAGYIGVTVHGWAELYEDMGVALPLISLWVVRHPVALPLALAAGGVGLLVLGRLRTGSPALRAAGTAAALALGLASLAFLQANVIVMEEAQRALQQ